MRSQETDTTRTVSTKAGVFVLGKNEQVVGGEITNIYAAPLGRYGLVIQKLPSEAKLWLYDALRATITLLHRIADNPATKMHAQIRIYWFPETERALIQVSESTSRPKEAFSERISYGLVDAQRKNFRRLSAPFDGFCGVETIRDSSTFLLNGSVDDKPRASAVMFLTPEGKFSPVSYLDCSKTKNLFSLEGILPKSNEIILSSSDNFIYIWYAIRVGTNTARLLPDEPKDMIAVYGGSWEKPEPSLPLVLDEESAKLVGKAGSEAETTALWLRATDRGTDKKKTEALVAVAPYPRFQGINESAGIDSTLLADLSAVLYLHEGSLYATSLTKKP